MNLKEALKQRLKPKEYPETKYGSSNEATRIEWLKTKLNLVPSGKKILDAGAGEQPFKKFCAHLNYTSQDFGQYDPTEIKKGLQMGEWDYGKLDIISDIASIPKEDRYFDAIMCTEVLEHIINPRNAIEEFSRLLKKDGYLILTAPFCSITHFAPYHFYTGFSKYFYESELQKNGFEILEIKPNGNYFEYLAQELSRLSYVASEYNNHMLNKNEINDINALKILLEKLGMQQNSSDELLCFGYYVFAKRI